MCGLYGTYANSLDVDAGLDKLAHRGPDGRGIAKIHQATHGHVRLALMDLTEASAQPFQMYGNVLSYNGELWNHADLRRVLEQQGIKFKTTGDTEVVAAAVANWGLATAVARFVGMYAFAWSTSHGKHFLVRDRYGKIPLYVDRVEGGGFEWSSERKAMQRPGQAIAVPPGHMFNLDEGVFRPLPFPADVVTKEPFPLIRTLRRAVRSRIAADAPVCCLISGGLDSALILTLAQAERPDVVAYTAVYDEAADDLKAARRLCSELGVPLREVPIPAVTPRRLSKALHAIEIVSKAQVEIAFLCLPLAEQIAADGFKACLSGEAADELFGGYGNSCIRAASLDDAGWVEHRRGLLTKMSRGNFVRCNKAFMARGVECRLPFMEPELVETVLAMGKDECPPGKKLLKEAAAGIVPDWCIKRTKDTFQGGSGVAAAAASVVASPIKFYNSEARRLFGALTTE